MPAATFAIPSFLGGCISAFAQGRFDKPDYRISLNVCTNSFPVEIGPWTRRPGTMFAGTTLNGLPGRVVGFEISEQAALTLEFTDSNLRFRSGATLVTTVFGGSTPLVLKTPYISGSWNSSNLRGVQAEQTQILLSPSIAPQALVVTTLPSIGVEPSFTLNPAVFNDGPYLDPFTNGVQAVPGSKIGIVTLTISFPAYDSTKAYAVGSFVTSSSINYISLVDQNVGNTPVSSPSQWAASPASAAINNGLGFLGTDIGRLVRLFSEPPLWTAATNFTAGEVASYNPSGVPGAATYWQAQGNTTGNPPGADLTNWKIIASGAALWTWGKVVSLSNIIDRALSGSTNIGNMTLGGGVASVFNGVFSQGSSSSAEALTTGSSQGSSITLSSYVGKNYTGASAQKIEHATIYPSADLGLISSNVSISSIILNLRASASLPSNSSNGTLLGTTGSIGNNIDSFTIISSDQSTAWNYVWVELVVTINPLFGPYSLTNIIGQLSLFSPTGTGVSSGVNVEILGPALLYTNAIVTWRLGAYSNTTGYPTCGVYNDGRLYLGGAIGNRFDACYANGIVGGTVNFAPTDQFGVVSAANAISYTFNSKGVNQILWMRPDLQGVKAGTQKGEWLIQAPTAGAISPLNISARQVTSHGSANIDPVDTEHTLIFVQRFAHKPLEYFPDVFSGKFSAPNLADKAQQIVRTGIAELAYTSAVTPIVWGRCTDGSWFGITYKRDSLASAQPSTFYGWHQHQLGSGRIVESICAGPSVGGNLDALTMVTNDPATNIRYVEILTDTLDEDTALANAWYLDAGVVPTVAIGSTSVTLSGLPYPDGKVVQAFASGLDLGDWGQASFPPFSGTTIYASGAQVNFKGKNYTSAQNNNRASSPDSSPSFWTLTPYIDFTVAGGSITVPFGDGVAVGPGQGLFTAAFVQTASFVVGFTYNSDGQSVRPIAPADTGARNGPALGKIRRIHRTAALLSNTLGISFGTDFGLLTPSSFKLADRTTPIPPLTTYSGVFENPIPDQPSYDGMLCWRVSRPFPATVVAISGNLETAD